MTEIKKVVVQQPIISTNINSNSSVQLSNINIGQNADIDISNRAVELGITVDQYNELCEKDETFKFADINYQKRIVEQYIKPAEVVTPTSATLTAQSSAQTTVVPVVADANDASEPVAQGLQAQAAQAEDEAEEFLDDVSRTENYDFTAFDKLGGREKLYVIFTELARNNYLYGNKNNIRTPEDWDNLSEEEKNNLINQAKEKFFAENADTFHQEMFLLKKDENVDEERINRFLQHKALSHLETVLLANWLGVSSDEYKATRDNDLKADDFNEAFGFNFRQNENLTISQKNRFERNINLTKAFGYFLATKAGQPDNSYWVQTFEQPSSLECLKDELNKYNEELGTNYALSDIREMYMKYQMDNGEVSAAELENFKERYDNLVAYNKSSLKNLINTKKIDELIQQGKIKLFDPPVMNSLMSLGYTSDLPDEKKQKVISQYLDESLRGCSSPQERADVIVNLMYELIGADPDNGMLVSKLHRNAVLMEGNGFKELLADRIDMVSQAANASNIDAFGDNPEVLRRIQQNQQAGLSSTDIEIRRFAESVATETMDNATVEQNRVLSKGFASSASEVVQDHHVATAYRINRENPENGDIVAEMLNNTALYSTDEVRANATERVGELSVEYETSVLTALTKDCSLATQRAIEKDVASTLDVRNQADAVKLLRDNVQTQMSGEDVDKYLTTLADNIHNLDRSVQQDALNHIYESGNQAAINKALENLTDFTKTHEIYQEAGTPRLFEEIIVKTALNDADLAGLDLTQQLSSVQIASLTPAEKQTYYMNMFKQASANDKIKILEKIPNGTQKKTIFTVIARFAPGLLETMVEQGLGVMMLSSNLPMDASSKVLELMVKSKNPDVERQIADLINDKDYHERIQDMIGLNDNRVLDDERERILENNYMSLPQDFMRAYEITPEEMQRMQKTMWLLDQAGRFKA